MPESKYSKRRIEAALKQRRALELRLAGRTFQEIADAIGYRTPQGAIMAVKAALQKTLKTPAEEWRAITIERLTAVLRTFWPAMLREDPKAADKVFRAIADLRALLGLDAPAKVQTEVDLKPPIVEALKETTRRMANEHGEPDRRG